MSGTMTRRGLLPLAALAALLVTPAAAQQPTQAQASAIRSACRSDYMANCSGVPTGGRAALQCLQQHAADLSPSCQQAVAAVGAGAAQTSRAPAAPPASTRPRAPAPQAEGGIGRACFGDFRALCPGERPGGGRLLGCLADHRESLSPGCAEALSEMRRSR